MSTSYSIYRFTKPEKKELTDIKTFSEYDMFPVYANEGCTDEHIALFRLNDKRFTNIINSKFSYNLVVPEIVTNYTKMFQDMRFDEKAIKEKKIYLKSNNGYIMNYTDGENIRQITSHELKKYNLTIKTACIAAKIKCLWNSDDVSCCLNRQRILKYIPELATYKFAHINNTMLAKAEIPFLIYEKNTGRCFIKSQ